MFIKKIFKKTKKIHSEKMPFELWRLLTTSFLSASPLFISKIRIEMGEDFTHLELRGICLKNFDLTNANFEETDLSDADLRGANLENAKLVSTKLNSADLSNTKLTGICIQNWQVTDSTKFEGVDCKYIYLTPENQKDDFRRELNPEELEDIDKFFKEFLISSEAKKKIKELKELFDTIDLIGDKVIREYRLAQAVKSAKDSHGIEDDIFHQMFEDYRKQKLQAKRQSSWWQNFLWFKLEPSIERLNNLTKEMDVFPLLEQIGRLSILIAVITYVNNALQPPKLNVEEQYRSWEILRSDNDKVKGIRRFALEQLRDTGTTLTKIQVPKSLDLSGINLSNADLTGAILTDVNLEGANLSKAKLQGAHLEGTHLKNASLGYLSSSDQNSSKNTIQLVLSFLPLPSVLNQGADLKNAHLQKADLTYAHLQNAQLQGADLQKTILTKANLTGAKLLNAKNLGTVIYGNANLTNADLQGTNLTNADLQGTNLTNADLQGADLKGANLQKTILTKANLTGAKLLNAKNLGTVIYGNANLTNADLQGTNLTNADLQGTNLTNADLQGADLKGANLKDANLKDAKYSKTTKFPKGFKPQAEGMVEIK